VSETEQTLQDNCMFAYIYSTQEEGWQPVREAIVMHTNPFSKQQEQEGIISPSNKMTVTSLLCRLDAEDLIGGIIKEENQIKIETSTPLINNLEMQDIFKGKDDKEGNGVTDRLITEVSQLLELVTVIAAYAAEM